MAPPNSRSAQASVKAASPMAQDATALLRADDTLVSDLFADYENARSAARNRLLVAKIRAERTVHALEGQAIFYPAVKTALKGQALIPEVTRLDMKALGAQIAVRKAELLAERDGS